MSKPTREFASLVGPFCSLALLSVGRALATSTRVQNRARSARPVGKRSFPCRWGAPAPTRLCERILLGAQLPKRHSNCLERWNPKRINAVAISSVGFPIASSHGHWELLGAIWGYWLVRRRWFGHWELLGAIGSMCTSNVAASNCQDAVVIDQQKDKTQNRVFC